MITPLMAAERVLSTAVPCQPLEQAIQAFFLIPSLACFEWPARQPTATAAVDYGENRSRPPKP